MASDGKTYNEEYVRLKQINDNLHIQIEQYQRKFEKSHSEALPLLLQNAEEKLAVIEERLLQAEETIVHLQAEKKELKDLVICHEKTINNLRREYEKTKSSGKNGAPMKENYDYLDISLLKESLVNIKSQLVKVTADRNETALALMQREHDISLLESKLSQKAQENQQQSKEIQELKIEINRIQVDAVLASEQDSDDEKKINNSKVDKVKDFVSGSEFKVSGEENRVDDYFAATKKEIVAKKSENFIKETIDGNSTQKRFSVPKSSLQASYISSDADDGEIAATNSFDEWKEEILDNPKPSFHLDSPEVEYLLKNWTTNRVKMDYLKQWLHHVAAKKTLGDEFPRAIQLSKLLPEIKAGFLTLIIPLLTHSECLIEVHSRFCDNLHSDLRIRVKYSNKT